MAYVAFGLIGLALVVAPGPAPSSAMPAHDLAHALKTFGTAFCRARRHRPAVHRPLRPGAGHAGCDRDGGARLAAFGGGRTRCGRRPATGPALGSATDTLRMHLDHATGEVDGGVKRGPAAGRALSSLGQTALLELLDESRRDDPTSVPLLETYLDRRVPDWRAHAAGQGTQGAGQQAAPTVRWTRRLPAEFSACRRAPAPTRSRRRTGA